MCYLSVLVPVADVAVWCRPTVLRLSFWQASSTSCNKRSSRKDLSITITPTVLAVMMHELCTVKKRVAQLH